jgi:hypothetical protein
MERLVIGLSHILAYTYGVCAMGPTPCKLAPHYLQGFTGMVMCRPCIEVALTLVKVSLHLTLKVVEVA